MMKYKVVLALGLVVGMPSEIPAAALVDSQLPPTDLPYAEAAEMIRSARRVVLDATLGSPSERTADDSRFNYPDSPAYFRLDEGLIDPDIYKSAVWRDGIVIDRSLYELNENYLRIPAHALGRNDYIIEIPDRDGHIAVGEYVIWAVDQTTDVVVLDRSGRQLSERFEVTATLTNRDDVSITGEGAGGARLAPLPCNVPVRITAREISGNRVTSTVYTDRCASCIDLVSLRVLVPGDPSAVDNNDFSLGTSGWTTTGAGSITLLEHGQLPPGFESDRNGTRSDAAAHHPRDFRCRDRAFEAGEGEPVYD